MNRSAFILSLSLLVGVVAVLAAGSVDVSLAETDATSHIPVEAEDASEVALDNEVDTALHHADEAAVEADQSFDAIDAEMGVSGLSLDSNTDLSLPADQDSAADHIGEDEGLDADEDAALLAEGESVSVAMGDDSEATATEAAESESASAAVDSDEDASFLQVVEEDEAEDESEDEESDESEDEAEAEDESEDEAEDESEDESEAEDEEALQTALIEQIVEADVEDGDVEAAADAPRLSEVGVEIVADADTATAVAANADLGVTVAEEDHTHDEHTEMVDVADFDTAKLAEVEANPARTGGSITAGLMDATIEAKNVEAEGEPVTHEVIALVSDHDARAAAGAPVSLVETDAADESEEQEFAAQTNEELAAEQQKLDLMHSILVQVRTEQGRPVDDELTPSDMDLIEQKMAVMSMVEVSADTETDAAHPRDHTVVAAVSPSVQDTTPGAKLSPATIVGNEKPVQPRKPKYRWDVQFPEEKRKFLHNRHIEYVDKAHPLHRRDPTGPSKLLKPVKPGVWDQRPFETRRKQQYRYDVQYEKRSACCRRREACCIRGVGTKTIAKKVKKPVRVIDPVAEARKARKAARKARKQQAKQQKQFVRVEYEAERAKCCSAKAACCAPPQAMYRADVQYSVGGPAADYVVVARSGERALVIDSADQGTYDFVGDDVDELSVLERIQARQQLLHKLLLTHDSPYYYDDHFATASDAHIALYHEPRAASDPNQLTVSEAAELQQWMSQLPVVPHLSVVEVRSAAHHAASGDSFLQTAEGAEADAEADAYTVRPVMKPARVMKGFVDVEQDPTTLSQLLSALPPMPASAEEAVDEEASAMAEAEADAAEDI